MLVGCEALSAKLRLLLVLPCPHCCYRSAVGPQVEADRFELKVQRCFKPEDISRDTAYSAGLWDLYAAAELSTRNSSSSADISSSSADNNSNSSSELPANTSCIHPSRVVRKCAVKAAGAPTPAGKQACQFWFTGFWFCAHYTVLFSFVFLNIGI